MPNIIPHNRGEQHVVKCQPSNSNVDWSIVVFTFLIIISSKGYTILKPLNSKNEPGVVNVKFNVATFFFIGREKNNNLKLWGCQPSASYLCKQTIVLIGLGFVASGLASYWWHSNTAQATLSKATAHKHTNQETMNHKSCSSQHFHWSHLHVWMCSTFS